MRPRSPSFSSAARHGLPHRLAGIELCLALAAHVHEHLREDLHGAHSCESVSRSARKTSMMRRRGHDAVARGLDIAEDDMTGLLATEAVAVLTHAGGDVFVSDGSRLVAQICTIEGLEQTEVAP